MNDKELVLYEWKFKVTEHSCELVGNSPHGGAFILVEGLDPIEVGRRLRALNDYIAVEVKDIFNIQGGEKIKPNEEMHKQCEEFLRMIYGGGKYEN